ncbi:MAG: AAA family ATPase [Clostridia bacterium]|nr:AAA family ATPase [Clostridia bacterium]
MQYGLIGEKLGHSFSADIHARLGDYDYRLVELSRDELGDFMTKKDFAAINVTIPYKQDVIPYLDELDSTAAEIGAVNTIVNRGGRLTGYNTDFYGMSELIKRENIAIEGKNVAILGTGGTSKTAAAVVRSLGAASIVKVSRTPKEGEIPYEELYARADSIGVIINTTPVGMYPRDGGIPIQVDKFKNLGGVIDAVYNPLSTNLVLAARERGIPARGGLYMLVAQAARAAELFFDDSGMMAKTEPIFRELEGKKLNIVLVGMPGSGKTTVGHRLAELTGRNVIDSDDEIVAATGMPIPEYFTKYGEGEFRNRESEVIEILAQKNGTVIATGGGAVLREQNVNALRRNGVVVFLDRSVENIVPTADRPLSRDREALQTRYRERYPIYCKAADIHLDANGSVDEVADRVIAALHAIK